LRSQRGVALIERLAGALERWPLAIYLINVPNLLVGIFLGPHWPNTNNLISDWANLIGSGLTFYWGYVFASDRRLLDLVTRRRREFLILGILIATVFFTLRATQASAAWPASVRLVEGNIVSGFYGMAWIFALIGYARAGIRASSAFLRYATEAVYPFYIFHQTITVALVFYLANWAVGVWPKLFVVAAGTFLGSWLLFEFVRRIKPLRPLFGLKPN
jgi:surface polysaccharide O-acyltransferase-like enzyme